MRLKLIQYFKDQIGSTGILFLTLLVNLNKSRKRTLKATFSFLKVKQIFFGVLTADFRGKNFDC